MTGQPVITFMAGKGESCYTHNALCIGRGKNLIKPDMKLTVVNMMRGRKEENTHRPDFFVPRDKEKHILDTCVAQKRVRIQHLSVCQDKNVFLFIVESSVPVSLYVCVWWMIFLPVDVSVFPDTDTGSYYHPSDAIYSSKSDEH